MTSLSNSFRAAAPLAVALLLVALLLPCRAAAIAAPLVPATPNDTISTPTKKEARRLRRQHLDSLRREMRRSAHEGRILQWADSVVSLRRQQKNGGDTTAIDTASLAERRRKLAEGDKKLTLIDKIITSHYFNKNIDTTYISRPTEPWTVKLRSNLSGTLSGVSGHNDGTKFSGMWAARFRHTLSAAAVYKGIGLGLALNPSKLIGKSKDMEYHITSYGNRMGVDMVYETSKSDNGSGNIGDHHIDIKAGDVKRRSFAANYYYAFNGKRFSFPAAFTQSYKQRRSAGSWLIGASFQAGKTNLSAADSNFLQKVTLRTLDFAIGAGYAHNICIGRRWLAHLSLLPTIVIYDHSSTEGNSMPKTRMKYRFPNILATGHTSLLYSWKRHFAGVSSILDGSYTGTDKYLAVYKLKWRIRLSYGFRF